MIIAPILVCVNEFYKNFLFMQLSLFLSSLSLAISVSFDLGTNIRFGCIFLPSVLLKIQNCNFLSNIPKWVFFQCFISLWIEGNTFLQLSCPQTAAVPQCSLNLSTIGVSRGQDHMPELDITWKDALSSSLPAQVFKMVLKVIPLLLMIWAKSSGNSEKKEQFFAATCG